MPIINNGVLFHQFVEPQPRPGMRLGRHQQLDGRSLAYTVSVEEARRPIHPAAWVPPIPTLDQGNLGSCTGNAGAYHLSALYGKDHLGEIKLDNLTMSAVDGSANERFAIGLYSRATAVDPWPGTYPPDDTGSSGLAVSQVLKRMHLINSYQHATSLRTFATLLQRGGVITGWPWYDAWFSPDNDGFVDSGNWEASGVAGGHEIYCEALESWDEADPGNSVLLFHNSWGDGWGDHGCFRMRGRTYNSQRSQVDVQQFHRRIP
jgi:hypothetical protein